ncbi:Hypothetical protein A7982_02134 [Minicystis rosea]|nr:Hypothetical protein A7982_02134 [Minicystis rosea]
MCRDCQSLNIEHLYEPASISILEDDAEPHSDFEEEPDSISEDDAEEAWSEGEGGFGGDALFEPPSDFESEVAPPPRRKRKREDTISYHLELGPEMLTGVPKDETVPKVKRAKLEETKPTPTPRRRPTIGMVTQASLNMHQFGALQPVAALEEGMDEDSWLGTSEWEQRASEMEKIAKLRKAGKKDAKVDATVMAMAGAARHGHPLDFVTFHEVSNGPTFARMLEESAERLNLGIDIDRGQKSVLEEAHADKCSVVQRCNRAPKRTPKKEVEKKAAAEKESVQHERYPIAFDKDLFQLETIEWIPTYGDERGVPQPLPDGPIRIGRGKSRPVIVYTMKSKTVPDAPPMKVAVVHTKPIGTTKTVDGKNRTQIYEQLSDAYAYAKEDAESQGSRWTFVGDHYLADRDLVGKGRERRSFKHAVETMGLTPVAQGANTNTMEQIDRDFPIRKVEKAIHTNRKDRDAFERGVEKHTKDGDLDAWMKKQTGAGKAPKNDTTEKKIERKRKNLRERGVELGDSRKELVTDAQSPGGRLRPRARLRKQDVTHLDRKQAQVADRAVVTSNLVVARSGIVSLRPAPLQRDVSALDADQRQKLQARLEDPDLSKLAKSDEEYALRDAGKFLSEDASNQELAWTSLFSDHAMMVLVTSDSPGDDANAGALFDDAPRPPRRTPVPLSLRREGESADPTYQDGSGADGTLTQWRRERK